MNRRSLYTIQRFLWIIVLIAVLIPVSQAAAQVGTAAYVNTGRLNIRSGPSVAFSVVVSVPSNTQVTLIGRAVSSSWVQIVLADGTIGWANSIYMRTFANLSALPITYDQVVPPVSQPTTGGLRTHTVRAGETLQTIAARYGTSWQILAAVNGLPNANFIYAGQVLTISNVMPTTPTTPTVPGTGGPLVHVVQAGETLQTIAAKYGTTWQAIAAANSLINPNFVYTGQRLVIAAPPPAPRYHTVQPGERLFQIALQYGVTVQALAAANGIINPNLIYPNQRLLIP